MLLPKRTKFRKKQKGRIKGLASRGHRIEFGDFGLKGLEPSWITGQTNRSCPYRIEQIHEKGRKSLDSCVS